MRLYYCENCGGVFEREEVRFVPYKNGEMDRRGMFWPECPVCGSEDIYIADACERCEAAPADGWLGSVHLCGPCRDAVLEHVERHISVFSEEAGIEYETAVEYFIGWSELKG